MRAALIATAAIVCMVGVLMVLVWGLTTYPVITVATTMILTLGLVWYGVYTSVRN